MILGKAGETYYIDAQGVIQSVIPSEENGDGVETEEDITLFPDNELMAPITITQAEFEAKYVEEMIELNSENSSEYFEEIEEGSTYHFVLKEGYTSYGDGYTIETNAGSAYVSAGASRYLFELLDSDNSENWIESWTATGTIVKYNIPEEMWYKVRDLCLILIERHDGAPFSIER